MTHVTLTDNIKGFIDVNEKGKAKGWAFYSGNMTTCPLRLVCDGQVIEVKSTERNDVADYYRNCNVKDSGWEITLDPSKDCVLEMNVFDKWLPVFSYKKTVNQITPKLSEKIPSFVVVDDFYEDPDLVRQFALTCNFQEHPANHKGKRTDERYLFPGLKERFEGLIGAKITDWHRYGTNGCFQYCVGGDQIVYHRDQQQYAGVLFLTPEAPSQSGTAFYKSVHNGKMKIETEDFKEAFSGGYLDPTNFVKVDTVGNVYNRLVLFDARLIHSGLEYFGTDKDNGRLFQLFFFDLE